tara:strand:+ start:2807 stop:3088 length:282 start_codon:yes stop_codon:yes gene_type:complete
MEMTPEELKEQRYLEKARAAYDEASPNPDTSFGQLSDKETNFKNKVSYPESAKKPKFTSAETKGGASLMYRKPMAKGGSVIRTSSKNSSCPNW